jgi:Bardet-Biedl syndrome 5 protein
MMNTKVAEEDGVWQDREIRFDTSLAQLAIRPGEFQIDSINSVEDTKGNNGEKGSLAITNLRLVWICHRNSRINLSIGYSAVQAINIKTANSRLRGNTQALYVMTKYNKSRFEFVFTNLVRQSPRLFTTVQAVYRAYDTSRLFRDLKLRGAIIKDKALILLPNEQLYNKVPGVWNLSSDQGNLGTFFITNVRLVWHANMAENFNVSIPYLQMKLVRVRDSKFGPALVIETSQRCGGYILGFRVDPAEQLQHVFQEVSSLHTVFSKTPIFGVDFANEEKAPPLAELRVAPAQDDVEFVDTEAADSIAAYYAEGNKHADHEVVLSPELGLAIERLPEGITAKSLWAMV